MIAARRAILWRCICAVLLLCALQVGAQEQPEFVPYQQAPVAGALHGGKGEYYGVTGTVTLVLAPGFIFLQDESGAMRVVLKNPPPTEIVLGDRIQVIVRDVGNPGRWFEATRVEHLGPAALPVPEFITPATANAAQHDASFVTVRGRVTAQFRNNPTYEANGKRVVMPREVLLVDCDGGSVEVIFDPVEQAFERFPVGTRAEFTGAARFPENGANSEGPLFSVSVRGIERVRVLEAAPVWLRPEFRLWLVRAGWIAAFIAPLLIAWLVWRWRQRQLAKVTEERLREINASLEQRVAERTADLTRTQDELRAALKAEQELSEIRANFVSLVSHEFRTPLGVIMSAADVLRLFFQDLPKEKREHHLAMITRSTRTLANLIEEVLLIRRVEEGKQRFEPVPVELRQLCITLVDEVMSASNAVCPIQFLCDDALEGAMSDETLLRHILSNLLSNAAKYSNPGQPVEFSAERRGDNVVLTVKDQGIGILPEDRVRLFESFMRGRNVGNRPGTGLGLLVVKRCVDLHGGALDLQSTPGKGTCVTITLPAFKVA